MSQFVRSILSITIVFALVHNGNGQVVDFKRELFDRGLEKFRQSRKRSQSDLFNAFESAASLRSNVLAKKLITEFKITDSIAFWLAVDSAQSLPNSQLALQLLPRAEFSARYRDAIAELSFIMGKRGEDFESLLRASKTFLESPDPDNKLGEREGKAAKDESQESIRQRRTEFLQFNYHRGRLQDESTLEPPEKFLKGITDQQARQYLSAVWLVNVGSKVLTGTEQLNEINKYKSKDFAVHVLFELLTKYDQDQLHSMVADSMISKLFGLYLHPDRDPDETDLFVYKLEEKFTQFDYTTPSFNQVRPDSLISLAKRTQAYQDDSDILKLITSKGKKTKTDSRAVRELGESLIESSLRNGNIETASVIAKRLSLKIPNRSRLKSAIEQGDFQTAKKIVDASPNDKSFHYNSILASALILAGRNDEAETYVDQLKKDYRQKLENQSIEKRAKWIVNFAMAAGWSVRDVPAKHLPIEDAILKSFEQHTDTPKINESLSTCIDSFTPPTAASRRLLLKMMKMLPESKQLITSFDVNNLAERILAASKKDQKILRTNSLDMIKNSPIRDRNSRAGLLAYSFATAGDQEGVNKLIEMVSTSEDQAWILFQCAIVFPPQAPTFEKQWYRQRRAGGMF